jgi:tRNA pseudouridine38-40 synthase
MRVLFTIQYLGTRYAGWQMQANATGVQQIIEAALERMFGAAIRIEGAGRTDAGVHARAQRAHADIPFAIPHRGFLLGLNNLLPQDIRIIEIDDVPDDFHCRFDAKLKTYVYQIWNAQYADVFAHETHAHVAQTLDDERMRHAAAALTGKHDFRAFTVAAPEVSSTERTVESVEILRDDDEIRIRITADGFLRFMVRRIAGSLIEIGRGKLGEAGIARSLEPRFEAARWTAPAKGLVLWQIDYGVRPAIPVFSYDR